MARSLDINQLVQQPESSRNEEWESAFLQALIDSKLSIKNDGSQQGPDGWPYLFATTPGSEPAIRIIDWCARTGVGLVINAQKELPDYIFPYGMLWNYKEHGEFISTLNKNTPGQIQFNEGQKVHAGPPSNEYLPTYVRKVLRSFFKDQKVEKAKILVMSEDKTNYDLCFSLESIGNPPAHEHKGIAEALSWFLPGHYSILLISEKDLPEFVLI